MSSKILHGNRAKDTRHGTKKFDTGDSILGAFGPKPRNLDQSSLFAKFGNDEATLGYLLRAILREDRSSTESLTSTLSFSAGNNVYTSSYRLQARCHSYLYRPFDFFTYFITCF